MNADGLSSPEQWGVWDVDGLGLCIAFRGTASTEDVLIDMNIKPMPLEISINMRGVWNMLVHFLCHVSCQLIDECKLR